LIAPDEVEIVPFRYLVEDDFLTVTVWPAEVEIVKPDADTLATVPTAPPAAGPDRALPAGGAAVPAAAELVPEVALTMP
jgi:hypothetical protein